MSEKRNVSVNYNGNTSSPSAVQLQDVLNVSNPLQVSKGNPGLKKSYSHHLSMRYTSSEPMNSRFFWANFDVQQTINQISSNVKFIGKDTLIDGYLVSKGGSLTMPVNLNGMWSMNVHTNYSMPVKKSIWISGEITVIRINPRFTMISRMSLRCIGDKSVSASIPTYRRISTFIAGMLQAIPIPGIHPPVKLRISKRR